MTAQHPAAPETETDVRLTEAEREALADEIRAANIPILMGWRAGWMRALAEGLAPIIAERVRVVDAALSAARIRTLEAALHAQAQQDRAETAEAEVERLTEGMPDLRLALSSPDDTDEKETA